MKILIAQPWGRSPGHFSPYTRRLCTGLLDLGHEINLLTFDGFLDDWDKAQGLKHYKVIDLLGAKSKAFLSALKRVGGEKYVNFFIVPFLTQRYAFKMARQFDVVHLIDSEYLTYSLLRLVSGKSRRVISFVGEARYDGTNMSSYRRFKIRFYDALSRGMLRSVARRFPLIAHARHATDWFTQNHRDLLSNIDVIPWGIDDADNLVDKYTARKKLGISCDGPLFLMFGVISRAKTQLFLDYFNAFCPKDCTFLIAGKALGNASNLAVEADLVQMASQNKNIILHNRWVSEQDVPLYFGACDAFVLCQPKNYTVASGTLNLAISHRRPVVAGDAGQIGEIVGGSKLGILYEADNHEALAKAIRCFMGLSQDDFAAMMENMGKYALANSWRSVASRHLAVYLKAS